ncbi:type I-E CRISPR-associated protein Cse2/CasB [Streptomyces sp. NBC_00080]
MPPRVRPQAGRWRRPLPRHRPHQSRTPELAQHLRGLVSLLRRARIGMDYDAVQHALRYWDDLQRPDEQSRIRTRWDRDFRVDPAAKLL